MDAYRFDIRAYREQTADIGPADDLAYRRLIDLYYVTEGPLHPDVHEVAKEIDFDPEVVAGVLEAFFTLTPEGWLHERIRADILARQPLKTRKPRKIKLDAP